MNDYCRHVQLDTTRSAIDEEEERTEDAERAEQQQAVADAAGLAAVVEQTEVEADQQQGAIPVALNPQSGA